MSLKQMQILDGAVAVKPEQEPVAWLLTDKNINSLQVDSIQRLIDRLKHAHHTDIRVRINGHDEWFEADWLKHMVRVTPPQPEQEPEYAWPTVADYERDVGFQTNEAFRIAWNMARTTNRMLGHTSSQPAQQEPVRVPVADNTYNYAKSLAEAITALKERLAQPEQEPVAWPCLIDSADFSKNTITLVMQCDDYKVSAGTHWLSTTPPKENT